MLTLRPERYYRRCPSFLARAERYRRAYAAGRRTSPRHESRENGEEAKAMAHHALTIPYTDDLLLSLKESPEEFEAEA